jgi:flagellar basal body rod protein FlgC
MGIFPDAVSSALAGLNSAEARLERTAERLARVASPAAPADEVSLSGEMINLILAKASYEVNLKSLETAGEMERSLIDLLG